VPWGAPWFAPDELLAAEVAATVGALEDGLQVML
jgi:hypothetical protein